MFLQNKNHINLFIKTQEKYNAINTKEKQYKRKKIQMKIVRKCPLDKTAPRPCILYVLKKPLMKILLENASKPINTKIERNTNTHTQMSQLDYI